MRTSALGWLLLVAALVACQSGSGAPQSGSESHFLVTCNATCSGGFECLCGVCTEACASDATCSSIRAEASCVDVQSRSQSARCDGTTVKAFCDVRCVADAECNGLGSDFVCSGGFCRQGASGRAGDPIPLDAVCEMYVADVCRAKIDCFGWDYKSYEACLDVQECDGLAKLNELLARGSVRYDAAATGACHAKLQRDACSLSPILFEVPKLPEALALCGALSAQLGEGATCDSTFECATGLSCQLGAG